MYVDRFGKSQVSWRQSFNRLPAGCRQPGRCQASPGNATVRSDFDQRREDEGAQVHARVRQLKSRAVDYLFVVEQQVEVERARRVVIIAPPSELAFDGEQRAEQIVRRECRCELGDGVDEVGLVGNADRRRAVERRGAQQLRLRQRGEGRESGADLGGRIGEVGAERDVGKGHRRLRFIR